MHSFGVAHRKTGTRLIPTDTEDFSWRLHHLKSTTVTHRITIIHAAITETVVSVTDGFIIVFSTHVVIIIFIMAARVTFSPVVVNTLTTAIWTIIIIVFFVVIIFIPATRMIVFAINIAIISDRLIVFCIIVLLFLTGRPFIHWGIGGRRHTIHFQSRVAHTRHKPRSGRIR